jgi:DNA-binding protein
MTKAELIEEVAKIASLTKKETELIVNTVFDNITDALSKGDKVELRGFGSALADVLCVGRGGPRGRVCVLRGPDRG